MRLKLTRLARFAPVTASLTTLALVAACARTNGRVPISAEAAEKMVSAAKDVAKAHSNYDENDPNNQKFAALIKGASLDVSNRDATNNAIDASVKVVFTNELGDIVAKGKMSGSKFGSADGQKLTAGQVGDKITMEAYCVNPNCQLVNVQLFMNEPDAAAEATPSASASTTASAEVSNATSTDVALADKSASPATDKASVSSTDKSTVASTDDSTKNQKAATPKMHVAAQALITFSVDSLSKRTPAPTQDDDGSVSKAAVSNISNEFVIRGSTPTDATLKSGNLMSFEAAFKDKYKKEFGETSATDAAQVGIGTTAPAAQVGIGTTAPAAQVGIGTTSPEAQVGVGTSSPSKATVNAAAPVEKAKVAATTPASNTAKATTPAKK